MATITKDQSFLGKGWGFPPEFDKNSGSIRMVSGEEDIKESLRILLSTAPGERTMHPKFGCGLKLMIFENLNESVITEINDTVTRSILFFEPRISLNNIEVDSRDFLNGVIRIDIQFTIRSTNSRSNMVFPHYILEGTNI